MARVPSKADKFNVTPVRYPGGKQRFITQILSVLPPVESVGGKFIEPFVGGGSVFFAYGKRRAVLSDLNAELITLYRGIKYDPDNVWRKFRRFPGNKRGYYKIRDGTQTSRSIVSKAARTLYLNRTCFKGMWRHNAKGRFNVGYGGQTRRWVITRRALISAARALRYASLKRTDFEETISSAKKGDCIFADPPYKPGRREMQTGHYVNAQFTFKDHRRLATALKKASRRGVKWVLTTSAHPDILSLFPGHRILPFRKGVGANPGEITTRTKEILIRNF